MDSDKYWTQALDELYSQLDSSVQGLGANEAKRRLTQYGPNALKEKHHNRALYIFLSQFKNPIVVILIVATIISAVSKETVDAIIIFLIIILSSLLSFYQEYSANNTVKKLQSAIQKNSKVLRDGKLQELSNLDLVPGDVVELYIGSIVPADGVIIESQDFAINQAALTGESLPVDKDNRIFEDVDLEHRSNCVYMGSIVHSGFAKVLVVKTGNETEFGTITQSLDDAVELNDFEIGIRHFGFLLTQIMLILTISVFAINVLLNKPPLDSLLFSVALAVGITPQLLPVIISVTLSKGSKAMAKEGVIVRKLSAIENFGCMDILCTDKTGTLTEGVIGLNGVFNIQGEHDEGMYKQAYINASLQTALPNSLDQAIIKFKTLDLDSTHKVSEIPYDFNRKRLSITVFDGKVNQMICKGALQNVVDICSMLQVGDSLVELDASKKLQIETMFKKWSSDGMRVLGLARKVVGSDEKPLEENMIFQGFLLFMDPVKDTVIKTIESLNDNGVELKIITGDNQYISQHIAHRIGLDPYVLTGREIARMSDADLQAIALSKNVFAEVDPTQKERIVRALKVKKHVVGYMGDGINDIPALNAADVGISVNNAVDVAKETADFILQTNSLEVLKRGIILGRTTFNNTIKYILITTSANFGNMFSMAGASLFLPFLPLLPKQILLINFLSDFPAITIANDNVDQEQIEKPKQWDIKFITRYMLVFGLISSVFDYITFGVLLLIFKTPESLFQSSWFLISIVTELVILILMRTQKQFFKSRPSPILLFASLFVTVVTFILIFSPLNQLFYLQAIPVKILMSLFGIIALYSLITEYAKLRFYERHN